MRLDMTLIVMALLVACRPATVLPTPTIPEATAQPLTGSIEIITPFEGAVIYSELIALSGVAAGLPENAFALTLTGPDGEQITTATVRPTSETWSVELAHTYAGEPIEVTISAHPLVPTAARNYTQRTVALAGLDYRPDGAFGSITRPMADSTVGGEFLLINGTASGVPTYALTIDLIADDGRVVSRTYAQTSNPYLIDDMPWTAELGINGHFGPAIIQLGAQNEAENTVMPLDSIQVQIETAAG